MHAPATHSPTPAPTPRAKQQSEPSTPTTKRAPTTPPNSPTTATSPGCPIPPTASARPSWTSPSSPASYAPLRVGSAQRWPNSRSARCPKSASRPNANAGQPNPNSTTRKSAVPVPAETSRPPRQAGVSTNDPRRLTHPSPAAGSTASRRSRLRNDSRGADRVRMTLVLREVPNRVSDARRQPRRQRPDVHPGGRTALRASIQSHHEGAHDDPPEPPQRPAARQRRTAHHQRGRRDRPRPHRHHALLAPPRHRPPQLPPRPTSRLPSR